LNGANKKEEKTERGSPSRQLPENEKDLTRVVQKNWKSLGPNEKKTQIKLRGESRKKESFLKEAIKKEKDFQKKSARRIRAPCISRKKKVWETLERSRVWESIRKGGF